MELKNNLNKLLELIFLLGNLFFSLYSRILMIIKILVKELNLSIKKKTNKELFNHLFFEKP